MEFKTLFTGKNFIELDSVDSTNNYAANLSNTTKLLDGTVIMAHYQKSGKGQMGNEWHSTPGENIMISIVYKPRNIDGSNLFLVSKAAALGVKETIDNLTELNSKIKWPNDIYLNNKKISGMLIENQWQGNQLTCIIGIGINVNQTNFPTGINATSLSLETSKSFNIKQCLTQLVLNIEYEYLKLNGPRKEEVVKDYMEHLWFRNISKTFKTKNGEIFQGSIVDVRNTGELIIKTVLGEELGFFFKEVNIL